MDHLPPTIRLVGIGWYVAICIVGGVVGGLLLDKAIDLAPVFTLVGLFVGLAAAFYGGYRMLMETLGGIDRRRGKNE
jgi:F0F1-type ATP synthase assembly protein I